MDGDAHRDRGLPDSSEQGGRDMKRAFATCVLMLAGIFVGVPGVGVPEVGVADVGLDDCVVLFFAFFSYRFGVWHTGP